MFAVCLGCPSTSVEELHGIASIAREGGRRRDSALLPSLGPAERLDSLVSSSSDHTGRGIVLSGAGEERGLFNSCPRERQKLAESLFLALRCSSASREDGHWLDEIDPSIVEANEAVSDTDEDMVVLLNR